MADLDPVIAQAAQEWNLDPHLLRALAGQETGGSANPDAAVSSKGARGRLQLLPDTARGLGVTDLNDPVQNIYAGAKYLSEGLDKEGNVADALRYYHGGPDWRSKYGPESAAYVPGVTEKYQALAGQKDTKPVGQFDDFLAATGAAPAGGKAAAQPAKGDDFSDFLANTGAAPAKPAAPAEPSIDPITGFPVDGAGKPTGQGTTLAGQDQGTVIPGNSVSGVAAAIPKTTEEARALLAEKPGYTSSTMLPIRVKNGADGQADPSQGVELDLGPLRPVGNALLDLMEGTKTGKVTPEATALLAQAATGGLLTPSPARGTGAAITQVAEHGAPLAELYAKNKLTAGAPEPAALPAPANKLTGDAPAPQAAPAPNSVGAAASAADDAKFSPKETRAYQAVGEKEKLNEPQPQGQADNHQYVQGVTPTTAEIEQTVNAARELKAAGTAYPEVSQKAKEIAAENNEARRQHFQQIAGSDVDVMNAKAARGAQAEKDLAAAFSNKKPTDAKPVSDAIESILNSPRGSENTALQQYVKPLLNRLQNADGTLKSDPEQLYGLREDINRMQSKAAKAETPTLNHVSAQLDTIKAALDEAIEKGASGYQQYLKNYSDASRPIDSMEALQGFENKLYTGSDRRMGYNQVQNMMRQIVEARQAPGINPLKSIPDETMQKLWMLRDDLRRSASAQELAKAPGSDTAQNAMDLLRLGGNAAMHAGANMVAPGIGSLAVGAVKQGLAPIMEKRAARKGIARGMDLLQPKTPLRNPLLEP